MVWGNLRNVEKGTAFVAEPWGVLMGLQLTWNLKVTQLILEIDNKSVVETIRNEVGTHRHWNLIRLIQILLDPWNSTERYRSVTCVGKTTSVLTT